MTTVILKVRMTATKLSSAHDKFFQSHKVGSDSNFFLWLSAYRLLCFKLIFKYCQAVEQSAASIAENTTKTASEAASDTMVAFQTITSTASQSSVRLFVTVPKRRRLAKSSWTETVTMLSESKTPVKL